MVLKIQTSHNLGKSLDQAANLPVASREALRASLTIKSVLISTPCMVFSKTIGQVKLEVQAFVALTEAVIGSRSLRRTSAALLQRTTAISRAVLIATS